MREFLAFATERLPWPAAAGHAWSGGSSALRSIAVEVEGYVAPARAAVGVCSFSSLTGDR
ncbi:hypothetical protein [Benzoatithermus flavus]|uniref:hypothetical protein n=1 Tax=Benzoatithermus flavus TaxID=3108223 RepID=UPI003AAAA5E5